MTKINLHCKSPSDPDFVPVKGLEEGAERFCFLLERQDRVLLKESGILVLIHKCEGVAEEPLCHECATVPERLAKAQEDYLSLLCGEEVKMTPVLATVLEMDGYETAGIQEVYACGHTVRQEGFCFDHNCCQSSYVMVEGRLYSVDKIEEVCPVCIAQEQEKAVDARFHELTWIHALDAYRGRSAQVIQEHMDDLMQHPSYEVCCSNYREMAGEVAVILKGTVTGVFSYDCWSLVDQNTGKRYSTRATFIGDDYDTAPNKIEGQYAEAWVKDFCVQNIVITENIAVNHPRRLKVVKEMARKYRLPVFIRRWDDNNDEEYEELFFDPEFEHIDAISGEVANVAGSYMEGWV